MRSNKVGAAPFSTPSKAVGGGTLITNGEFRGCVIGAQGRGFSGQGGEGDQPAMPPARLKFRLGITGQNWS